MDTREYVPAKYCSKCGELKPLSEYYLRSCSNQHRAHCNVCSRNEQKHYDYENRVHNREYNRQYFQDNKERIYDYRRNRYHTDDAYRIIHLLRNRLHHALNSQGAAKHDNTMNLIGCTPEWLTEWLNYTESVYCNEDEPTNIDNVIPLSAYNLFDHIEQHGSLHGLTTQSRSIVLIMMNRLTSTTSFFSQHTTYSTPSNSRKQPTGKTYELYLQE